MKVDAGAEPYPLNPGVGEPARVIERAVLGCGGPVRAGVGLWPATPPGRRRSWPGRKVTGAAFRHRPDRRGLCHDVMRLGVFAALTVDAPSVRAGGWGPHPAERFGEHPRVVASSRTAVGAQDPTVTPGRALR